GAFTPINGNTHREYNVVMDIPAAQQLAEFWPTSIIFSGFEIGLAILYPAASIDHDFRYAVHHPVQEAYQLYGPTPRESPTWDLTSVLWAVRPQRGYFDLSPKGRVTVDDKGETRFKEDPTGKHQYLIVTDIQKARVREALALLASQPPLNR
ncbi:MAG: nucleoside hydrolase, partial [Candidatus Hydrogenedentota bacterium]